MRGGIPLCFPIFGNGWETASSPAGMPQHGFARISNWKLDLQPDSVSAGSATLLAYVVVLGVPPCVYTW